jgi:(R,R)-butanediol dehydrogenase/meso-butanediol dehydrogenase/diacetyl reductase
VPLGKRGQPDRQVFLREIRILGARVYQRTDFERAVELVVQVVITAAELITRIEPITETARAFAALESGQAMKILIDLAAAQQEHAGVENAEISTSS